MAQYPDFIDLIKSDEQGELMRVNPSLQAQLSNCFAFFSSVIAVIVINVYCHNLPFTVELPFGEYLSLRWLSAIPALLLLEVVRKFHDELYVFEKHRIARFGGRLSLTYQAPNIRFSDIKAVVIHQDLLGRILDYGDIELSTAAQGSAELSIKGINAPEELALLIEHFRLYSMETERKRIENIPQTVTRKAINA
jgi:hypothetical protein